MKIAILISHFPPAWLAGTEIATYNLARELANLGNDIHIITLWDKDLAYSEKIDGFTIHRIKLPLPWLILQIPYYFIQVLYLVWKINPDIIHPQAISLNAFFAMFISKILNKPYIAYAHGSDVYKTSKYFKKYISKPVIKNAKTVVCLTEDMRKEIIKIFPRDVTVIGNGIEIQDISKYSRDNIRMDLNIENCTILIIFVGRLHPIKGISYLLDSIKIVIKELDNIQLLIVGDGEYREYLEEYGKDIGIENNVKFIGSVPHCDVIKYMIASDIFILPSLSEGFPITILEAMSAGLPIIATNVGGIKEILKSERNGFLVEPKNSQQIAEKIIYILKQDLLYSIKMNNIIDVKKYTLAETTKRIKRIYLEAYAQT